MSLFVGAPAPLFIAPAKNNPTFAFGSVAGRYLLLCFLPAPGPERDAIERMIGFSQAAGILKRRPAYDEVVAAQFAPLWSGNRHTS